MQSHNKDQCKQQKIHTPSNLESERLQVDWSADLEVYFEVWVYWDREYRCVQIAASRCVKIAQSYW